MKSGAQTRLIAVLLAVFTLAAVGLAIANFMQENNNTIPTDGVRWTEAEGGVRAASVPGDSPAARFGVRKGDILIAVDDVPTPNAATAQREIQRNGAWSQAKYSLLRKTAGNAKATALEVSVILTPSDRTDFAVKRLIALVYLALGLYVLFRRWTAPQSTHFF